MQGLGDRLDKQSSGVSQSPRGEFRAHDSTLHASSKGIS